MAAENETEEDIVGDILEKEGVSRNPPEASGSIASVPETSGQISSFDEGPVVVQNSTQNGTIN